MSPTDSSVPVALRIVKSQLPIALTFAHHLLVLLDGQGRVLAEIDGLATSKAGRIKPIGYLLSDRLKVYRLEQAMLYRPQQVQATVFEGPSDAVQARWQAAYEAGRAINARHVRYPLLGLGKNSNSVISTLIACMGLPEPALPGRRFAPGCGAMLLPHADIHAACRRFSP